MRWYATLFIAALMWQMFPLYAAGSEDYRVGGGDILEIKVFEEDNLSRTVRVSADGVIAYPLIGKVKVGDLTPLQIADRLTELLARDYLVNPQVSVNVAEYVSKQVQVLGAVKAPGMYNLTGKASVTTMLARAGGVAEQGGKTLLLLKAGEQTGELQQPHRIDVFTLLNRGDKSLDLEVAGGDILFVPRADEVYVMGEVTQPGAVVYQEGMTLLQAISKVGAFKPTAATNRIQIIRRVDGKEQILRVDGKKIQDGKEKDQLLQPEDLITVPRTIF
jgi:polysaccharide export outer membrane protein